MRFAVTALNNQHEVKVFLMGEGVEIQDAHDEKFDIQSQTNAFLEKNGSLLACGTCLKSRNREGSASCPLSTMGDCLKMVEWADKILTF